MTRLQQYMILKKEFKFSFDYQARWFFTHSILRDCDEYTELFYYGIAHIPLIFRAGFQIGDEGKVRLLHKDRNEQSVFKEISAEADNYTIELKGHYDSCNKASKEMLVVVTTSFPVSSKDLEVFKNNNIGHELRFEMCNPSLYGVNSIFSYALMNRLRTGILNKMREIVSSANIEKYISFYRPLVTLLFSYLRDSVSIMIRKVLYISTIAVILRNILGEFPIRRFRHPQSFDRPPKNINIQ